MYKCNDCGKRFEEPKITQESRGEYWGAPCWEMYSVCPYCKSDDIDEETEDE